MSKLATIIFSLIAFFLFIVLSSMENYPRDSIVLFLFTVGIYLILSPKTGSDKANKAGDSDSDRENEFSEFIGTKIYHNTFFYDIDKIERSPDFEEDRSYHIHATNEETGQPEVFPVNIDEMGVEDYVRSKQKSLKY